MEVGYAGNGCPGDVDAHDAAGGPGRVLDLVAGEDRHRGGVVHPLDQRDKMRLGDGGQGEAGEVGNPAPAPSGSGGRACRRWRGAQVFQRDQGAAGGGAGQAGGLRDGGEREFGAAGPERGEGDQPAGHRFDEFGAQFLLGSAHPGGVGGVGRAGRRVGGGRRLPGRLRAYSIAADRLAEAGEYRVRQFGSAQPAGVADDARARRPGGRWCRGPAWPPRPGPVR